MKHSLAFLILPLLLAACHHPSPEQANREAERCLWSRPDSSVVFLQTIRLQGASEEQLHVHQLLLQAALLRLTYDGVPEDWESVRTYFAAVGNKLRLGQCLYYQGTTYALRQQPDSARSCLLQVLESEEDMPPVYIGMTHYRLAVLSEDEQHYVQAYNHYAKALPILAETGDSLLTACCWRDIARMSYVLGKEGLSDSCFAQADALADAAHLPVLRLDIAIQQTGNRCAIDSAQLLRLYQLLGREGNKQHYAQRKNEMTILQDHLMQEKSLRIQRHWGLLLLLALLLCLAGVLTLFYMRRQRERYSLRLQAMEQERLRFDLDAKRKVLQTRLRERVSMPDGVFDWNAFYQEFDAAYDGLLSRLVRRHPELTDIDKRYLTLVCLGFDTADICQLLNLSKRTIYNRRQILKQRLGIDTLESIVSL